MSYLAIYLIVVGIAMLANYQFWNRVDPLEPEVRAESVEAV